MEIIWVPALYIAKDGTKIDFTGYYEANNLGEIRSVPHYSKNRYSYFKRRSTTLKQQLRGKYLVVDITFKGKKKKYSVNRLILSSFNPDGWFEGAECHHIDENSLNNKLDNLMWLSSLENINWGDRVQRIATNRLGKEIKKNTKNSKIVYQYTPKYVFVEEFPSTKEAERKTGIKASSICRCCNGFLNTAGGYVWSYKNDWGIKKAV